MAAATISTTILSRQPIGGGLVIVVGKSTVTKGTLETDTDLNIATGLTTLDAFIPGAILGGKIAPTMKSDNAAPKSGGVAVITVDDDAATQPSFSWIAVGKGGL